LRTTIVQWLKKEHPLKEKMLPTDWLGDKGSAMIANALEALLADVAQNPQHQLREQFDAAVQRMVLRLQTDPDWARKGEEIRRYLQTNATLGRYVQDLWQGMRAALQRDLADEHSAVARNVHAMGAWLGRSLAGDAALRQSLNQRLESWVQGRAGAGSRPGGRGTCSLLRQRKVPKRKATLQSATPALATGQTCGGAFAGCAVELALRCALRSDNHGESDHEACALRRPCHPANAPPQAQPEGGGQPNSPKQPHGPSLRSAQSAQRGRLRPRGKLGRAKQWPVWMSGCGFPSGCAEERSGQRIRARDCLSEASSSETPLDASTAGCPQRSEGTQPVGSLFLWLTFFWRGKRK
jgi:hypothetical protein